MPITSTADQTLVIFRGEDVVVTFSPETATDIDGWSLAMYVSAPGSSPALTLTTAGGAVTVTDGDAGEFEVDITRAQTLTLTASSYLWDVWRTDSGSAQRLAGGQLTVRTPQRPTS